jgi:hypothetical protein
MQNACPEQERAIGLMLRCCVLVEIRKLNASVVTVMLFLTLAPLPFGVAISDHE